MRQLLLVVLLSVVVLTAGCSGLSDGDSTNGIDTEETPTDGTDRSSDDDWNLTDPEQSLRDAGSYTSSWTWRSSFEGPDSPGEVTFTSAVDSDGERALTTMRTADGDEVAIFENFYADGKQHTRFGSGDGTDESYFVTDVAFESAVGDMEYGYVYDASDLSEWSFQGTETYDGVSVKRYTYDAARDWFVSGQEPGEFDVDSAEFEMLVGSDGIPRLQVYRVEGVDESGTEGWFEWEYTVTAVGTTTVDDPAWLSEVTG